MLRRIGHYGIGIEPSPTQTQLDAEESAVSSELVLSPVEGENEEITETPKLERYRERETKLLEGPESQEEQGTIAMYQFNKTFLGNPGQDPADYLDDIEDYVEDTQANKIEAEKDKKRLRKFRQGLGGPAQTWYERLRPEQKVWGVVDHLFLDEYARPDEVEDVDEVLENFTRKAGEPMTTFLVRADNLSRRCNMDEKTVLRNKLYRNMCDGEKGREVKKEVSDRLYSDKLLARGGRLSEECTFRDVYDIILDCIEESEREEIKQELRQGHGLSSANDKSLMIQQMMMETLEKMQQAMDRAPYNRGGQQQRPLFDGDGDRRGGFGRQDARGYERQDVGGYGKQDARSGPGQFQRNNGLYNRSPQAAQPNTSFRSRRNIWERIAAGA